MKWPKFLRSGAAADYARQAQVADKVFAIYTKKLESLGGEYVHYDEGHFPPAVTQDQLNRAWEEANAEARKV